MFIEVQLIHDKILQLKVIQHKFYDFSRSSFNALRNRWIFKLIELGINDLKRDQIYRENKSC